LTHLRFSVATIAGDPLVPVFLRFSGRCVQRPAINGEFNGACAGALV
jgi:hypothetical protein